MSKKRRVVTATVLDAEGFPFIVFKGTKQDVADAVSIYATNVASPLTLTCDPQIDFIQTRDEDDKEEP